MTTIISTLTLGQVVREVRKRQGLRQDELAGAANVGVRFIVDLEGGKPTAQLGKALAVMQALGLRLTLEEPTPSARVQS